MKAILRAIFLFLVLLSCVDVNAQDISREEVKHYLAAFDSAIKARDVDAVGALMSGTAILSSTFSVDGERQTQRVGKSEYLNMLRELWSRTSNYQYRRSNERIEISGNKARVSCDVFESMIVDGQYTSTRTVETGTLEKVEGKVLLTEVVANQSL